MSLYPLAMEAAEWQNTLSSHTSAPDILLEVVRAQAEARYMSHSAYKYGGRHREYCQCPMCGEGGGKHTLGCVCPACGSLGGTHEQECLCPFCNNSNAGHHKACRCPRCGETG